MIDCVFVDIESFPGPRYSVVLCSLSSADRTHLENWVNEDRNHRSLKTPLKEQNNLIVCVSLDKDLKYLFSHYALRSHSPS